MKYKTCPSCHSTFTSYKNRSSRLPLLLKCGHTFCENCILKNIVKIHPKKGLQKQQISCSTCKNVMSLPNGMKDIKTNMYLCAQLEMEETSKLDYTLGEFVPALNSNKPRHSEQFFVRKCRMCQTSSASCKCVECDNILCNACFDMLHRSSVAIRQHQPVPLMSTGNKQKVEQDQNCKDHQKLIEYFCTDDKTGICSRCYIVGNHQGHSIISYEEKNKELLDDIEVEMESAQKVLHFLENSDDKFVSLLPDIRGELKQVVQNVKESFLGMHTCLQVREMEVIDTANKMFKEIAASLDEKRESFSMQRFSLEATLKDARDLMQNNSLIIDSQDLLEKLKATSMIPCIVLKKSVDKEESCCSWSETNKEELALAMQSFGSIHDNFLERVEYLTAEEAPPGYEDQDNDNRSSITSSSISSACRVKFQRRESTTTVESSEGVVIENDDSDADSDISKRNRDNKSPAAMRGSLASKQFLHQFQESIVHPVVKGKPQHVNVTHICSPNEFVVQLACNKRKMETLAHNINTWCRRELSAKHKPSKLEVGTLVLAKYSLDRSWYRAKVLGIVEGQAEHDGAKVHVQYIDYGNEEIISQKDLRNMEKRFMLYPEFAVRCSLSDLAPYDEQKPWSPDTVSEFQKITENQVFLLSALAEQDNMYEVDLICMPNENVMDDSYISVRDMLVFLELARFRVHSNAAKHLPTPPTHQKVEFIKPTSIKSGSTVDVIVTSVQSPSSVHITCQGDERVYYLNMMEEMREMYGRDKVNLYALYYPRLDCVCCVKGKDGTWYRAQVISPPQNRQVTLRLVDVGRTITVNYDSIKKLHTKFIRLPAQAIPCCLADVAPILEVTNEWSAEAKHWCCKTLKGAVGIARVKRWEEPVQLVLWLGSKLSAANNQSINYLLVERGLARSTGLSSVGVTQQVLYESSGNAVPSRRQATVLKRSPKATKPEVSQKIPAAGRTGSSSSSSSSSAAKPGAPPSPGKRSPEKREESASSKCDENTKARRARPKKGRARQLNEPEKGEEDDQEIKTKLKKDKIQQEIQRAMSNDGNGGDTSGSVYIEVLISSYNSPSDFVLRVQDSEKELQTLMGKMQKEYSDSSPVADQIWKTGDFCAVRYSQDALWYRGRVKSCESEGYQIDMVDFGYEEVVLCSELRTLKKELGQFMNCAAVKCHIANLLPAGSMDPMKWSRTGIEFMKNETKDRTLYIKQEGDVNEMGLPIDIIVELEIPETAFDPAIKSYHSLRQAILDQGLAMSKKRESQPPTPDTETINPFQRVIFEEKLGLSTTPGPLAEAGAGEGTAEISDSHTTSSVDQELAEGSILAQSVEAMLVMAENLVLPTYPSLPVGEVMDAFPTYVDNIGTIYMQPKEWEDIIIHLDYELQRVYGKVSPNPSIAWQLEQLCVAYFPTDDRWYRALITDLLEANLVQVQYIDYGNSETVSRSHLRELIPDFASFHPLALPCQLEDVTTVSPDGRWPLAVLEYMHELVVNAWGKMVIGSMEEGKPVQAIITTAGGLDLGEHLVQQGFASRPSDLSLMYKQSATISQVLATANPYSSLDPGAVGDTFRATLTHVELPNLIYLQYARVPDTEEMNFVKSAEIASINFMIDSLEEMTQNLNASKLMPLPQLPDPGFMCAAQFSFDDVWYRALVIESYKKTGSCLVLYVDFGTSEVIVARDRLRQLPTDFWELQAQALRVYFNIVPPGGPKAVWKQASLRGVIQTLANREIVAKVVQKNPLTVELLVEGENGEMRLAYETLLESGLAQLPQEVEAWKLSSNFAGEADEDDDVIVEERERGKAGGAYMVVEGTKSNIEKSEAGELEQEIEGFKVKAVNWWEQGGGTCEGNQGEISGGDEAETQTLVKEQDNLSSSDGESDEWTTDDDDDDEDKEKEGNAESEDTTAIEK